jgi:hypothetical protein
MVSVVQREWAGKNPRVIPGRPALTGRPGDANHCRGRSELADHRLPVPIAAVLPGDRCRRRADFGFGRARPRLPAKLAPGSEQGAGLPPRHRRECRDVDSQPDGGFHPLARLPRRRPKAFAEAGTTHNDVDHLMIYGAPCSLPGASFAHLPIYGLSGSLPRGGCYARRWEAPASPRGTNRDPPTCQFSRIPEQGHESRTALSVRKQTNRLSHLFSVVCEQADLVARKTRFVPRHGRRRASRRLAMLS